jgi:hypothetical protein
MELRPHRRGFSLFSPRGRPRRRPSLKLVGSPTLLKPSELFERSPHCRQRVQIIYLWIKGLASHGVRGPYDREGYEADKGDGHDKLAAVLEPTPRARASFASRSAPRRTSLRRTAAAVVAETRSGVIAIDTGHWVRGHCRRNWRRQPQPFCGLEVHSGLYLSYERRPRRWRRAGKTLGRVGAKRSGYPRESAEMAALDRARASSFHRRRSTSSLASASSPASGTRLAYCHLF